MLPFDFTAEDAYQEGFSNFCRGAPKNADLLSADSLNRFLAFWQKCVLNAILEWRRNQHRFEPPPHLLAELKSSAPWWFPQTDAAAEEAVERIHRREQLRMRIHALINRNDAKETLIFQLFFELEWLPREIFSQYAQQFKDYDEVALIIQRLKRRLRADETLQSLYTPRATDSALLKISLAEEAIEGKSMTGKGSNIDKPCVYDDGVILNYVIGAASLEIAQAIELSPECMKAAKQMAAELWPLLKSTYRLQCPESAELIDYQQQQITGTRQLELHRHLQFCPSCQQELNWLQAVDGVAEDSLPTKIRRVVEAIFQSPLTLPQPLRGEWLHYRTPAILLNIALREESGSRHTWTMRVQLRTIEGALITDQAEKASLLAEEPALAPVAEVAPTQKGSSLVFPALEAGVYQLSIVTATEEIMIRDIRIGES